MAETRRKFDQDFGETGRPIASQPDTRSTAR
jgi:hypothetical protein